MMLVYRYQVVQQAPKNAKEQIVWSGFDIKRNYHWLLSPKLNANGAQLAFFERKHGRGRKAAATLLPSSTTPSPPLPFSVSFSSSSQSSPYVFRQGKKSGREFRWFVKVTEIF